MRLEPINIVCPACGNPNYMRRIIGEHDEYFNAKCLNCNSYFNFEEIFAETSDSKGKNVRTNADRIRNMTDEELAKFIERTMFMVYESVAKVCRMVGYAGQWDSEGIIREELEWLKQEVSDG